eukprot:gb/GECG01001305.1/.p1 GENE.gb/GECG01001305.1/~~gb/GECG01001305.1/.p1  ORF type:complete len:286 (+),score=27.67 gb/GECG01001305.1/:1-858(+)
MDIRSRLYHSNWVNCVYRCICFLFSPLLPFSSLWKCVRMEAQSSSSSGRGGPLRSQTQPSQSQGQPQQEGNKGRSSSKSSLPSSAPLQKYKCVFLGDQAVGKTSIIKNFMYGVFENTYQATIGIDFLSKTMYLDDRTVRLQLWDTAGQERFRSLIPSYIRDSSLAVIVYDITKRETFNNLTKWIADVRAERGSDVVIMIAGNKTDLSENRRVTAEEGQQKANEEDVLFIECSAKTGYNIKALFKQLATALPNSQPDTAITNDSNLIDVKLNATPPDENREGGCAC